MMDDDDDNDERETQAWLSRPYREHEDDQEGCLYTVFFEVLIRDEQKIQIWMPDELTVLANTDAEQAITKIRAWVCTEATYGMPVEKFKIRAVELIGEAEVV